ncbi:hypothetical protein KAU51_00190 [Candidatus Parcubacteria bacterium]|nr:hypothetical protein [Candidatus Parcubacteria bacterium]
MRNIFILYMPPGNSEVMVHYEDTIKNKVPQERIFKYLDFNLQNRLKNVFSNRSIAVWGSRDSSANRSRFEKMQIGDDILIVEGEIIKLMGKVAAKVISPNLSCELWKNLRGESTEGWNLIYFIANPLEINLPFNEFKKIFGYKPSWNLRGFTNISDDRLEEFYDKYDDLYSILQKIKGGEKIEQKLEPEFIREKEIEKTRLETEDIDDILNNKELSEHIKMQWKLIRLGLKADSKVWIPRNDQSRIEKQFGFRDFEKQFASGIDVPVQYVENIDVVWKEEFRIHAAFEIENTTAIYSGLLRFSDLKIIAPNSPYPLFIVAPLSKKNRVFQQVKRPTFRELGFDKEVRYLAYEVVNEIDKFFDKSKKGLNVELLVGKSEKAS